MPDSKLNRLMEGSCNALNQRHQEGSASYYIAQTKTIDYAKGEVNISVPIEKSTRDTKGDIFLHSVMRTSVLKARMKQYFKQNGFEDYLRIEDATIIIDVQGIVNHGKDFYPVHMARCVLSGDIQRMPDAHYDQENQAPISPR